MNVLAIFAHPDDETILSGGVLALLADSGVNIIYVCATRGEGGELGEPPVCERDHLGEFREREMKCAVHSLSGSNLIFLDYIDPTVGPEDQLFPFTTDVNDLSQKIADLSNSYEADVIFTHGSDGEYGHPAHILVNQAVRNSIDRIIKKPLCYSVASFFAEHPRPNLTNKNEYADFVVNVSAVLEKKTNAALCHRSQNALFVRKRSQEAGRILSVQEVIIRVEGLHRLFPPYDGNPDIISRILHPWLQKTP